MPDASNFKKDFVKLEQRIDSLNGAESKVGWFESARYPDGTPVAYVAAIQEYGSPQNSIPSRSFMRTTGIEKQTEWANIAGILAARVVAGKMSVFDAFETIGLQAEGDFAAKIASIVSPPLSKITLGARKFRQEGKKVTGRTIGEIARLLKEGKLDISGVSDKPLVDSALMVNTLTHVTENTK